MHCWPFSILDNFDCCHLSLLQTSSRLISQSLRMSRNSSAKPLCTTVTSFRAPMCPPRSNEDLARPTITDLAKIRIHPIEGCTQNNSVSAATAITEGRLAQVGAGEVG